MSSFAGEARIKSKSRKIKVVVPKATDDTAHPKLAAFLFGVVNTLSTLPALNGPVILLNEDYKASINISVNFKNISSGQLPKKFKFKHFMPKVFKQMRSKFSINESDYLASFNNPPVPLKCKNMNAYISHDSFVILKVIDSECANGLIQFMTDYFNYVTCKNGVTYLPQYLGLYSIRIDGKHTYVIAMKNLNYSDQEFDTVFKASCAFIRDSKDHEDADDKLKRRVSGFSDFQKIIEGKSFQAYVTVTSLKLMLDTLKEDFQVLSHL